jgi:lysophospholipase L1-like esterase
MTHDIRICFVGDSFVHGTGDETALGWAGRLCAAAHAGGVPVTGYNLGVRRDTSRDVLRRWQAECSWRLPATCDGRIVFSFGVNDTVLETGAPRVAREDTRRNARAILSAASPYRRLVVGPPPVAEAEQNERIMWLSRALAGEAEALGVPYIDLFSSLVHDAAHRDEVSGNDGSHPASAGYARMAAIVMASPKWWFHGR